MSDRNLIQVFCLGEEIGRLGIDQELSRSFFQYNADFLKNGLNIFPATGVIRRTELTQVFSNYNNSTFRSLPPQIADSLPDVFGNVVFSAWLNSNGRVAKDVSVMEQLAYVANRGMGALEFQPSKEIPTNSPIDLNEIIDVLKQVLSKKESASSSSLDHQGLINIFKIGSSAGGARPKVLISENKKTGRIIPGDIEFSDLFNHYLVKLNIEDSENDYLQYKRELVEFIYYKIATAVGIDMMPSSLIDGLHFSTKRFDRIKGKKLHVLTACGLTGWDFRDPYHSSYENLFDLALFLKVPHVQIEQLFRRMVFNVVFGNYDDHLKNHSFCFDKDENKWDLSPAYDLTYSLNPLMPHSNVRRALSINKKRSGILLKDILEIADNYTIKNPKGIVQELQEAKMMWSDLASEYLLPEKIARQIESDFASFVV